MSLTWADVSLVAPELASLGSTAQDAILADVALQLNTDAWGSEAIADKAGAYLAAHIAHAGGYAGGGPIGPAGPVTSQGAGPYAVSYASPVGAAAGGGLGSTRYGLEYLRRIECQVVGRIGLVA